MNLFVTAAFVVNGINFQPGEVLSSNDVVTLQDHIRDLIEKGYIRDMDKNGTEELGDTAPPSLDDSEEDCEEA